MRQHLPGGMAASEFLRLYWQRKPLLVRNAIPGVRAWPGKRGLFALAQRADVESRLVSHRAGAGAWTMARSPATKLERAPRAAGRCWCRASTCTAHPSNNCCGGLRFCHRRVSTM
jgi:ribosomal protein L16 Arg81 hydroxylase